MRADNRVDVVHDEFGAAEAFLDFALQQHDVFDAIAVGDENRLARGVDCRLLHVVDERLDCLATAACFFHGNKAAFVVDVHHGFDIKQRARPCARSAHASAAEQEHQIVDGEPVA